MIMSTSGMNGNTFHGMNQVIARKISHQTMTTYSMAFHTAVLFWAAVCHRPHRPSRPMMAPAKFRENILRGPSSAKI